MNLSPETAEATLNPHDYSTMLGAYYAILTARNTLLEEAWQAGVSGNAELAAHINAYAQKLGELARQWGSTSDPA